MGWITAAETLKFTENLKKMGKLLYIIAKISHIWIQLQRQ